MLDGLQEILDAWYMGGGEMTGPVPPYLGAVGLAMLLFMLEVDQEISGSDDDDTPITVGWLRKQARKLRRSRERFRK